MVEFYTIEEVMENLKVSDKTVRRLIKKGELVAVKLGKKLVIPQSSYLDYITNKLCEARGINPEAAKAYINSEIEKKEEIMRTIENTIRQFGGKI